jgi:hypothetical protein
MLYWWHQWWLPQEGNASAMFWRIGRSLSSGKEENCHKAGMQDPLTGRVNILVKKIGKKQPKGQSPITNWGHYSEELTELTAFLICWRWALLCSLGLHISSNAAGQCTEVWPVCSHSKALWLGQVFSLLWTSFLHLKKEMNLDSLLIPCGEIWCYIRSYLIWLTKAESIGQS